MTREEQIAEKKQAITDLIKQLKRIERHNKARIKRQKQTTNPVTLLRRISSNVAAILQARAIAMQIYTIQSQPIAPDFIKGGIEAKVNYIEGKEPELIIDELAINHYKVNNKIPFKLPQTKT